MPKYEDITGQKFGRWTALKKVENHGRRTAWLCQCECGTQKEVLTCHLKSGRSQSCGCLRSEKLSEKMTKDLTGRKFGRLTVIAKDPERTSCNRVRWICRCECGNIKSIQAIHLEQGAIISCGCSSESNGELLIKMFLQEHNINFQQEYKFLNLYRVQNHPLRFDFAVFHNNKLYCLIEFQGIQHFEEVEWTRDNLQEIRERDEMKRQYCIQHEIPLIYIDYTQMKSINNILMSAFRAIL